MSATLERLHTMLDADSRQDTEANAVFSARADDELHLKHVPQIVCADGFKMSVQASYFHYCSPRDSIGPYTSVEVGFPSAKVDAFMPYIDGDEQTDPTQTVYGYVPVTIVAETIDAHGGLAAAGQ